jgi:hypothetical protein
MAMKLFNLVDLFFGVIVHGCDAPAGEAACQ